MGTLSDVAFRVVIEKSHEESIRSLFSEWMITILNSSEYHFDISEMYLSRDHEDFVEFFYADTVRYYQIDSIHAFIRFIENVEGVSFEYLDACNEYFDEFATSKCSDNITPSFFAVINIETPLTQNSDYTLFDWVQIPNNK